MTNECLCVYVCVCVCVIFMHHVEKAEQEGRGSEIIISRTVLSVCLSAGECQAACEEHWV